MSSARVACVVITVQLTDLTDDVDLYIYAGAFVTQQESPTNPGTYLHPLHYGE